MNAKIIEGLKALQLGIEVLLEGIETKSNSVAPLEDTKEITKEVSNTVEGSLTKEQLDKMTYNNLKKLAKDMNVSATGTRDDITTRLLNTSSVTGVALDDEEEKSTASKVEKKKTPSKKQPVEDIEEEDEEETSLYDQVVEATKDLSNEELADILTEVGLSPKGKREALLAKVVKAVEEGLLNFDDDDEENVPVENSSKEDPEEEEDEDDDNVNAFDNPDMTSKRKKELKAIQKDYTKQLSKKELTVEDMVSFLEQFHGEELDFEDFSDEDILEAYLDAYFRLVDDEGETHFDSGAYYLNGKPACCGRFLQYNEKEESYVCDFCGEAYELE